MFKRPFNRFLLLLVFCLAAASLILYGSAFYKQKVLVTSSLMGVLHAQVLATIDHSQEIPGLQFEEFYTLKNKISAIWNHLNKKSVLEVTGTDRGVRPYFVALQAIVEHVLAKEFGDQVRTLIGIIHTPMPATPLCSNGEISQELVDPSIIDPNRLFTVKARTTTIRDYLFKGGSLYIVYPKDGINRRTAEQQQIYRKELHRYSTHLFDAPLNTISIPKDLIGATYFFQDSLGNTYVFAIQMTQAKDPQETGDFGLWFGPLQHPSIQRRIQAIFKYMEQSNYRISNLF